MAQIRLIPSTYGRSNNSYVTVTNPDYMYDNTDDTTDYADIRGRNNSSYTYYCYLRGFNFSDIPANATITNFEVKIKAYRNSYQATGSSYRPSLCNNTSSISNTTLDEDLTTSTSGAVYTFPKGSLTWNTIKGYGSNFGIRIPLRRTGNTSRPYVYVYGAEILVDYTVPVYHNVSVTNNSSVVTVSPTGQQSVLEDERFVVTISDVDDKSKITVTDNGTDVTSQLVAGPSRTIYTYTIQVASDHVIVVKDSQIIYYKSNSGWVQCSGVYVKENGSWVKQTDIRDLFKDYTIYVNLGATHNKQD